MHSHTRTHAHTRETCLVCGGGGVLDCFIQFCQMHSVYIMKNFTVILTIFQRAIICGTAKNGFTHCRTYSGVNFCVFLHCFCFILFLYLFSFFFLSFFPVFTCKYILILKKAKAESALSSIYSCTRYTPA